MIPLPRTMPALITPFDASGRLDDDAHRHNVGLVADRGGRGVVVGGSTGQGPYLEAGERRRLVDGARAAADVAVVCGVFAETVRQAAAQAAEAEHADAVLVVTPGTLVRSMPHALVSFYEDVADASEVPVLLYSVPRVTGIELDVDRIRELAEHPNIVGFKDSGGQPGRFAASSDVPAGFHRYCGASAVLTDAHRAGATGAITASANYALTDVSLAVAGDAKAQRRLAPLAATVEAHGVAGTMVAAEVTGMRVGVPRRPLRPPGPEAVSAISAAVSASSGAASATSVS